MISAPVSVLIVKFQCVESPPEFFRLFRRQGFWLQPYDVTIVFNFLWNAIFLFICVIKFLVTRDLPQSQK